MAEPNLDTQINMYKAAATISAQQLRYSGSAPPLHMALVAFTDMVALASSIS